MAIRLFYALVALNLYGLAYGTLGDVCYIVGAKTALLNDRLYFMGGKYSIVSLGGHTISPTPSLYSLLVGNQFPVERPIPQSLLENTTIKRRSTSLAHTSASVEDGLVLWNTDDTLYAFGSGDRRRRTSQIAAYSVKSRTWKDVKVTGGAFNFGRRTNAQYVSVPASNLHFVYGGTSPSMGGMIRFDSKKLSWTNETLGRGSYGTQVPALEGGVLVYIPAGKEGILISFGGRNVTGGNESDWHIIYVYDIASHTWWAQRASGKPPSGRGNFCTSVVVAPDNGAFHITTYGGWSSRRNGRAYEDLHILSIPSFTWIDATGLSDRSNAEQQVNSTIGRDKLSGSCQTLNGRQMIILGGEIRSGALPLTEGSCSDDFEPVRVLDLSTYEWQWELPDSKEGGYQVPYIIYQKIGGGPSGGATVTTPKRGFADATLSSLLQLRVPTGSGGSTSMHPSTGWGSADSEKNGGAGTIAGAVAGGIGGIAIIGGLTWFLMGRKKKKKEEEEEEKEKKKSNQGESKEEEEQKPIPEMESVDLATSPGGESLVSPLSTKPSEMDGREVYELPI